MIPKIMATGPIKKKQGMIEIHPKTSEIIAIVYPLDILVLLS